MTAEQLRNSILQEAISGRLVPQDPNDETASVLLEKIRAEKARLIKEGKLKKEKPSAPITDDEKPFEIPESWEWCRIQDVQYLLTDGTHNRPQYVDKGVPFISVKDISSGRLNLSHTKFISQADHAILSKRCNPKYGDLLISKVGTTGVPVLVDTHEEFSLFVSVALIKYFAQYTLSKYLIYLINSPLVQEQIKEHTRGVGNKNWVLNDIYNTIIVLPPIAEQKRIVAKLDELLPIVEQYGKAQTELDELNAALPARLRQSILQEAISGRLVPQDENETADGLVKLILDRKKALLKSGELERRYVKELPIDDSEFEIELPKGWCLCKLGNIARISAGGTPARGVAAYWSNGKIPWLKISDITASDKYVNSASEYITEAGMNNSSAKLMKKGTLLYTIFASIGEVGILNFEATCNQAIANIDLYVPEMTNYIYYYLKNLQAYMYSISKGCAQLNINQDILKNAIVPLPPLAGQQRIVAKIEELFEQIDKISK